MDEPTEEQLIILKKDIMSGLVMIVEVEHYKRLTDNLDKSYDSNKNLQERIKELEDRIVVIQRNRQSIYNQNTRNYKLVKELGTTIKKLYEGQKAKLEAGSGGNVNEG